MINPFAALSLVQKIAGGVLLALLIVQTARIEGVGIWPLRIDGFKAELATAKRDLQTEREGRAADRAAYVAAQKQAAELNKATVQRIQTQQQRITANVEADLTSRLEHLRSELRKQGAAPQRQSGNTNSGQTSGGSQAAPDTSRVCLSTDQYVLGAEYEEKLDQWITWYEQQRQVKR